MQPPMVIAVRVLEIPMGTAANAPGIPMATAASVPISPRGTLIDADPATPDGTLLKIFSRFPATNAHVRKLEQEKKHEP